MSEEQPSRRKWWRVVVIGLIVGLGFLLVLSTRARRGLHDYRMLAGHEPIFMEIVGTRRRVVYSFPCRFFDVRKAAEKEMAALGLDTVSLPADTGRWWVKGDIDIRLTSQKTDPGHDNTYAHDDRKWKSVTIVIFDRVEPNWFQRQRERFFPPPEPTP